MDTLRSFVEDSGPFVNRDFKRDFIQHIKTKMQRNEQELINQMKEALAEWAAFNLFRFGYSVEKAESLDLVIERRPKENDIVAKLCIEATKQQIPATIQHYCYQFIQYAQNVARQNEQLLSQIKRFQDQEKVRVQEVQ